MIVPFIEGDVAEVRLAPKVFNYITGRDANFEDFHVSPPRGRKEFRETFRSIAREWSPNAVRVWKDVLAQVKPAHVKP